MRIMGCGCGNGASVESLDAAEFQSFGIDIAGFRAEQWGNGANDSTPSAAPRSVRHTNDIFPRLESV